MKQMLQLDNNYIIVTDLLIVWIMLVWYILEKVGSFFFKEYTVNSNLDWKPKEKLNHTATCCPRNASTKYETILDEKLAASETSFCKNKSIFFSCCTCLIIPPIKKPHWILISNKWSILFGLVQNIWKYFF